MLRTSQAVTVRLAIVAALTSPTACTLADAEPGGTDHFIRVVRAERLADDYGDDEVGQMFEEMCGDGASTTGVERDYPGLNPDDFPRMRELAQNLCD